ncbi:hypothetical protein LLB_3431 [Legionella longbeachae D-4968]|nr:hypothetical protein LLB_3431 [Legionella longbeachae D-4968]
MLFVRTDFCNLIKLKPSSKLVLRAMNDLERYSEIFVYDFNNRILSLENQGKRA